MTTPTLPAPEPGSTPASIPVPHTSGRSVAPTRRRTLALAAGVAIGSIGLVGGVAGGHASAIVDGDDTTIADNPWQVALTSPDGGAFCGGSIVSDRVVVTAAHCTQGQPEAQIEVRAGVTDLDSDDGQTRGVDAIVEHPKYVEGVGDIAMLVLDRPLDLGADVASIPVASTADIAAASTARVTGWGVESEEADGTPSVLQRADLPLVDDADCALVDEGNDDELCAGGTGPDSCFGDSGGPLTVATDEGRKLAGVVSWGDSCGGDTAGVYAEVPTFANWIAERVADPEAPATERLPAPEEGPGEPGDPDGEVIELPQEFLDEYSDEEIAAMTDEEFFEAIEPYLDDIDAPGSDDGDDPDEADDTDDATGTSDGAAELDINGDDIVQWSELDPGGDGSGDANGDGIVQWSELLDD